MPEAARARLVLAALLTATVVAGAAAAEKGAGKPASHAAAPTGEKADGEKTQGGKTESAKVDGFRSATFGMNEAQLRAAIRKDFNLAGDKVAAEENPAERTTALSIVVNDLLPDTGPARISYILGFKSKHLFQVNILWGGSMAPDIAPEKLNAAAASLRDYFSAAGYAADTVVTNARAADGSIVWFKGADEQKRTTFLRTLGVAPTKEGEKPGVGLLLSYVQDPQNPDIFRIAKGQF